MCACYRSTIARCAGWPRVTSAIPRSSRTSSRTSDRAVSHIDYTQRRRAERLEDDAPIAATEPDPEHSLSQQQRHERLHGAVRNLPIAMRQVVVLTLEGLSNVEVADVIGITENNVAVRLTRARAALTRALGVSKEPS